MPVFSSRNERDSSKQRPSSGSIVTRLVQAFENRIRTKSPKFNQNGAIISDDGINNSAACSPVSMVRWMPVLGFLVIIMVGTQHSKESLVHFTLHSSSFLSPATPSSLREPLSSEGPEAQASGQSGNLFTLNAVSGVSNETAWEPFSCTWPEGGGERLLKGAEDVISEEEFLASRVISLKSLEEVPDRYILVRSTLRQKLETPLSVQNYQMQNWFPQFKEAFIIKLEHGFVGDNVIFGPALRSEKKKFHFGFDRWWNGQPSNYLKSAPGIEHRDIDYAVAVGGWGATAFQHFVIDVLPKLALVYSMFISNEWKSKNVSLITNLGRSPAPQWFLEELGVWDRTLPMMGWPLKAKFIYRCKEVIYPDYDPPPRLLGKSRIGQYPRGVMLPIQQALKVFHETRRDRIVMLYRRGRRALARSIEYSLTTALRQRADSYNRRTGSSLEVEAFSFSTREHSRDLFRRALMIIGPHGGAFSNMVFSKPGTVVVEFLPMYNFSQRGSPERTSKFVYYGLSQACGHRYWFVNPEKFDFDRGGMVVDVRDVLQIVDRTLSSPLPP